MGSKGVCRVAEGGSGGINGLDIDKNSGCQCGVVQKDNRNPNGCDITTIQATYFECYLARKGNAVGSKGGMEDSTRVIRA